MASASHGIARTQRARTEEQRAKELVRIEKYRAVEAELSSETACDDPATILQATTKLLRLNPEHYTAWNVRRRCLISGSLSKLSVGSSPSKASSSSCLNATTKTSSDGSSLSSSATTLNNPPHPKTGSHGTTSEGHEGEVEAKDENKNDEVHYSSNAEQVRANAQADSQVIRSELEFTIPLLMASPKCYWIWNHRRWVLSQAIQHLPVPQARTVWEAELALDTEMLKRDQRNFHAWGYRRYIVGVLESDRLSGDSMAESEFAYTEKKINDNLSNFSAYHYRATLIPRVLEERRADDAARKQLLDKELNFVQDALNVGPEDQSLWFYHEHLMSHVIPDAGDREGHSSQQQTTIVPALTDEDRIAYLTEIIELIRDLLEDYKDVKFLYENLIRYTLALGKLRQGEGEGGSSSNIEDEIMTWLGKVRQLDPMREGRWQDVERRIKASSSSSLTPTAAVS